MHYIVTTTNPDTEARFWLRGSTWAFQPERATQYKTWEEAAAARDYASQFTGKRGWPTKRSEIIKVDD